jgi:uncharacterized protein (TIGR02271 family)
MQHPDDPHREDELSPGRGTRRPSRSKREAGVRREADTASQKEAELELREERLTARKQMEQVGEVDFRKEIEEVPGRLEVEAHREEVHVEHVPVDKVVREKVDPWEEGDTLVVPVYEEQLVVVKRLVMREQIRIRRVGTTEIRLVEDTLRRERLRIVERGTSGQVRERYPAGEEDDPAEVAEKRERQDEDRSGFLDNVARKILE